MRRPTLSAHTKPMHIWTWTKWVSRNWGAVRLVIAPHYRGARVFFPTNQKAKWKSNNKLGVEKAGSSREKCLGLASSDPKCRGGPTTSCQILGGLPIQKKVVFSLGLRPGAIQKASFTSQDNLAREILAHKNEVAQRIIFRLHLNKSTIWVCLEKRSPT